MTPEQAKAFHAQLILEAERVGWSLDLIEVQKFADSIAQHYNLKPVEIES